jgi:alpha-1,3-rhamnosyl/mannosyltransferase
MRIGVDATCWANGRGYGRFTRELLHALAMVGNAEEWVCFMDEATAEQFDVEGGNVRRVCVAQQAAPTQAAAASGYRSPRDMLRLTRAVWREKPDVFFSPSVYTYFPLPPGQTAVVAIHDTIPERFPELTLPTPRARFFWKAKVALAIVQARFIMTVSDYAARDIVRVHGVARARIRVVNEAPAATFRPAAAARVRATAAHYGLADSARWFVYVGGFNPHKRVEAIVRAHAIAARQEPHDPPHLLLVGRTEGDPFHGNIARIRSEIAACGTESLVHWTGFVADEALRDLHTGAVALVLASEAEGFGLPAVEAAACGTPVIATTASPLPQLLEGGGLFIEPGDADGMAAAMLRLLREAELRSRLGACAHARAAELTWENAAHSALTILREAAA